MSTQTQPDSTTKENKSLKITLSKSLLGRPDKHRRIARALGLTRTHRSVMHFDTPIIRGMIMKISHLLTVEAA